jgi:hypothetical protein
MVPRIVAGIGARQDERRTFHSEDIGSTFGSKGFARELEPACLIVEVAQIIVHEADEPKPILGLFDADGLAAKS